MKTPTPPGGLHTFTLGSGRTLVCVTNPHDEPEDAAAYVTRRQRAMTRRVWAPPAASGTAGVLAFVGLYLATANIPGSVVLAMLAASAAAIATPMCVDASDVPLDTMHARPLTVPLPFVPRAIKFGSLAHHDLWEAQWVHGTIAELAAARNKWQGDPAYSPAILKRAEREEARLSARLNTLLLAARAHCVDEQADAEARAYIDDLVGPALRHEQRPPHPNAH